MSTDYLRCGFVSHGDQCVLAVLVLPSRRPVYWKHELYRRNGPSSVKVTGRQIIDFVRERWGTNPAI